MAPLDSRRDLLSQSRRAVADQRRHNHRGQPFGTGSRPRNGGRRRRFPAIPGMSANFGLTDAIFQPRIADQEVAAQAQAAAAKTHDILLFTAVAYLDILRAFDSRLLPKKRSATPKNSPN